MDAKATVLVGGLMLALTGFKAYHALDRLINREWKTRLTVRADADGRIAFRGFKGRYRLSWEGVDGRTESRQVDVR